MPKIPNIPQPFLDAQGVFMVPPPEEYIEATRDVIANAVQSIKDDKKGVLTWIAMKDGDKVHVNAAFAYKVGKDVTIVAWIGKTWGEPIAAGIAGQWDF